MESVLKAVILAGGYGTRLSEETYLRPKPMVEIGGMPILWHIMKLYSAHGINEFIICCGYKGYVIKEYFSNYALHMADVTFDLKANSRLIHQDRAEPWKVTLVDTGEGTMTGGRLLRVKDFLCGDQTFCLTYGDGLTDANIDHVVQFHKAHEKKATLLSVLPPGRFGALEVMDDRVLSFHEKPSGDKAFVNGGFFVLDKSIFDLIDDDSTVWEDGPLKTLANTGNLMAYPHSGFWQPMDTLREKEMLEQMWNSDCAPWKKWT